MTEELLEKTFAQFGKLERVKKLKDYAFVHFEERDAAVRVGVFPLFNLSLSNFGKVHGGSMCLIHVLASFIFALLGNG